MPTESLPGLDDSERRCWQAFLESSAALLYTLNQILVDAHRLTMFDFLMLDRLSKSKGGLARMGDLAQTLVAGASRVTQRIARMEAEGLVRRRRSTNDGRGVIAAITCEGRARVQPAAKTYAQAVREYYLNQMSRQQVIAMADSCRRINIPLNGADRPEGYAL